MYLRPFAFNDDLSNATFCVHNSSVHDFASNSTDRNVSTRGHEELSNRPKEMVPMDSGGLQNGEEMEGVILPVSISSFKRVFVSQ